MGTRHRAESAGRVVKERMRCGTLRGRVSLCLVACTAALSLTHPAAAATLAGVATRNVDKGRISDVCASPNGLLYVCFPDGGYVAQYAKDGKLLQLIRREAGVEREFRPASCFVGDKEQLYVFDEASREVLVIGSDGNQNASFPLAYPVNGQALALSRVGHLLPGADGLWALLPDRSELARFDRRGTLKESLALGKELPYPAASYSRAQRLDDGTLLLLDHNQGAVLYRAPGATGYRRLGLEKPSGVEGLPALQDFAADSAGRILLLTAGELGAVLLTRGGGGYQSSNVQLPPALNGKRLACRPCGRGFAVWARDGGIVWLCEAR